jgi:hypothetical protein
MKEFFSNHFWIAPVVAAFATIGLGIFLGWVMTRGVNMWDILGDTEPPRDEKNHALEWMNNPANPSNPNSQLNPCNPTSIIWNNHN